MNNLLKKISASIGIVVFLGLLPISCGVDCNNPCGCGPQFEVKDFTIIEMEALTLVANGQRVSPQNVFDYNLVVKAVRIKDFQTVATNDTSGSSIPGVAFACSLPLPQSIDNLADVKITNLQEFVGPDGKTYVTGDDLGHFFGMNYYFEEGSEPIEEFLDGTLELYQDDLFKLEWLVAPQEELNLKFTIRVQLESGREFPLTDEILNIR